MSRETWTYEYREGLGFVILSDGLDGFDPLAAENVVAFVNETDSRDRDENRAILICRCHNSP